MVLRELLYLQFIHHMCTSIVSKVDKSLHQK